MDANAETTNPVRESSGKYTELYRLTSEHYLAIGNQVGIRFFDHESVDDMLYLHRVMMNPEVQNRMDDMEEVIEHWDTRWGKDGASRHTYVEDDLRSWMKEQDLKNILFAIAANPSLGNQNVAKPTESEQSRYKSEVFGFIYIYEKEADREMLERFGTIPPGYDGAIYETSSGKAEDSEKHIGSEARTLALDVFKQMYQESHPKENPIFTTDVAADNIASLRSVQTSGYEPVGTYTMTDSNGAESEVVVLKLNWEKHAKALEQIRQDAIK